MGVRARRQVPSTPMDFWDTNFTLGSPIGRGPTLIVRRSIKEATGTSIEDCRPSSATENAGDPSRSGYASKKADADRRAGASRGVVERDRADYELRRRRPDEVRFLYSTIRTCVRWMQASRKGAGAVAAIAERLRGRYQQHQHPEFCFQRAGSQESGNIWDKVHREKINAGWRGHSRSAEPAVALKPDPPRLERASFSASKCTAGRAYTKLHYRVQDEPRHASQISAHPSANYHILYAPKLTRKSYRPRWSRTGP